jgi:hypothetical protein
MSDKIYTLTYHEVQIAGYRVFNSYNEALKEYLKHCICETKSLLDSPVNSSDSSSDCGSEDGGGKSSESRDDKSNDFDEFTCVFEVQELQDHEYVTVKEYDYETFQLALEDIDNIPDFIELLEAELEKGNIPKDLLVVFGE